MGTVISLRGNWTNRSHPTIDQSVSLNIDGLHFNQGLAYESGTFDVGQVEVLKGPQSLVYGKNSPGGVIALRTLDPTDQTEVIGRAGYQAVAQEKLGELIVSGPVTTCSRCALQPISPKTVASSETPRPRRLGMVERRR